MIAAALAEHPEIAVHLTVVDELDDEDAAMVETVLEYVVKRSAERKSCQSSQRP